MAKPHTSHALLEHRVLSRLAAGEHLATRNEYSWALVRVGVDGSETVLGKGPTRESVAHLRRVLGDGTDLQIAKRKRIA